MIPDRENNLPQHSNEVLIKLVIRSVVCFLIIMVLSRVVMKYGNETDLFENEFMNETAKSAEVDVENDLPPKIIQQSEEVVTKVTEKVKMSSCPKSYSLVILEKICTDLIAQREICTPEDFYNHHKHENPRSNRKSLSKDEPKVPAIINYAVGGLLIASVGAALVELYKAKRQSPKKNDKNPLNRKCSLADLTVLKHHRKELIRRESIMEVPEESSHLKQLGFIPPSLHRRCSFPVGPHTMTMNCGLINDNKIYTESTRKMSFVSSRRTSVIDSRRTSVDFQNISPDERKTSVDDSPEKRHHRLVHRH